MVYIQSANTHTHTHTHMSGFLRLLLDTLFLEALCAWMLPPPVVLTTYYVPAPPAVNLVAAPQAVVVGSKPSGLKFQGI